MSTQCNACAKNNYPIPSCILPPTLIRGDRAVATFFNNLPLCQPPRDITFFIVVFYLCMVSPSHNTNGVFSPLWSSWGYNDYTGLFLDQFFHRFPFHDDKFLTHNPYFQNSLFIYKTKRNNHPCIPHKSQP